MDLQKKKTYRNKKYLRFVATLPCCICPEFNHAEDVIAAHTESGGIGMKGPDDKVIPLCYYHHIIVLHKVGLEAFAQMYNVIVADLIKETQGQFFPAGKGGPFTDLPRSGSLCHHT